MSYKRSQVEDTLWATFRIGRAPASLPAAFRTRIKKLLDLDRIGHSENPSLPLIFNDERAEGQGMDVPFTSFNAFMLGLALELWNAGLKQSDIIFFLRHCRKQFERQHHRIVNAGIALYQVMEPLAGWPTTVLNNISIADTKIFILIGRMDLTEASGMPIASPEARHNPLFFEPIFCNGLAALQQAFAEAPAMRRTYLVVEISDLAVFIDQTLKATPARRRGRPT